MSAMFEYKLTNAQFVNFDRICMFQTKCRNGQKCPYHHIDIVKRVRNDGDSNLVMTHCLDRTIDRIQSAIIEAMAVVRERDDEFLKLLRFMVKNNGDSLCGGGYNSKSVCDCDDTLSSGAVSVLSLEAYDERRDRKRLRNRRRRLKKKRRAQYADCAKSADNMTGLAASYECKESDRVSNERCECKDDQEFEPQSQKYVAKISELEELVSKYKARVAELEDSAESEARTFTKVECELDRLRKELSGSKDERVDFAENKCKDALSENRRLKGELRGLQQQHKLKCEYGRDLLNKNDTVSRQLMAAAAEITRLKIERDALEQKYKARIGELTESAESERQSECFERDKAKLKAELLSTQQTLIAVKKQKQELLSAKQSVAQELKDALAANVELKQEQEYRLEDVECWVYGIERHGDEGVERMLADMKNRVNTLKQQEQKIELVKCEKKTKNKNRK
eukprot:CAMPEP_0202694002 /NCGR_PEP_ID=MMETSP1385-20130828/7979_1 /ASSEMBLY_ACC=CAM_ASM_000861 /TAXON_ID=933848 /ORGANISM="Elphidium margaritaceum" /LENGTH=452 /DNA_ID=CAMNT_0049349775 /DNA_START=19 /DNA_END=1377 /DNA_ORIENTATION=-